MKKSSPLSWLVFISIFGSGVLLAAVAYGDTNKLGSAGISISALGVALGISSAIKIADQWEEWWCCVWASFAR